MSSLSSVRYIARENCYLHNGQRKFDDSGNAPERDLKSERLIRFPVSKKKQPIMVLKKLQVAETIAVALALCFS